MHRLIRRLMDAYLAGLGQFERLNLLALNTCNVRIGSGAYGHTGGLPQPDFDQEHVRPIDIWGSAAPQLFGCVSPQMHKEFGVDYELEWLRKFGLTYYGCCEPLSNKIHLLRRIPNLRKISMSPWNDFDRVVREIGGDYVFSFKPSPAVFAEDTWRPERARAELVRVLDKARGICHVEIIMKDISTVRYRPQALWEWARIAGEVAREYER
jgi:hypothetical protein